VIWLEQAISIQIGKLGKFDFPAGRYVYTGSARKNIHARIKRHLQSNKKLHWHIDYVLAQPDVEIEQVKLAEIPECELNRRTPGRIIVPHFGASDCKGGCGSHLKFLGEIPEIGKRRQVTVQTPV